MAIRVLLADDHAVLRAGLAMLINAQPDLELAGEAGDGLEAIEQAQELRPDVVVLDLSMGPYSGLEAIAKLRTALPTVRVLVLSMHTDPSYVRMAMAAGASGYVAKRAADTELLTAIRAVASGRTFLDLAGHEPAEEAAPFPLAPPGEKSESEGPLDRLSQREREVLERVAQGFTNAQIAGHLGLSVKSVETYRARVSEKLGFRTRAELVRFALGAGLLTPEKIVEIE